MRVCLLTDHYRPGPTSGARLMSELVDGLRGAGHEVGVVTARRRGAERERGVERVPLLFADNKQISMRLISELLFSLWAVLRLLALRKRFDHLLILGSPPFLPLFAGPAARLAGLPYSVILMDVYPDMAVRLGRLRADGPVCDVWRKWRTAVLERARGVLVVGACMKRRVEALSPRIRATVTQNWIDGTEVVPLADADNDFLREHPRLRDRFVVQYAGNMGLAQDFAPILAAATALRDDPDTVFLFVGDGAQRATLERTARERELHNVVFLPAESAARQSHFIGAASVCLITLQPGVEGLAVPSKFYPIVAAGKPVVAMLAPDSEVGAAVAAHDLGVVLDHDRTGELARVLREMRDGGARPDPARVRAVFEAHWDRPVAIGRYLSYLSAVEGEAP